MKFFIFILQYKIGFLKEQLKRGYSCRPHCPHLITGGRLPKLILLMITFFCLTIKYLNLSCIITKITQLI